MGVKEYKGLIGYDGRTLLMIICLLPVAQD